MGITIRLETESGTEVECIEDPGNLLHRALPTQRSPDFQWVSTIDWYGDTSFNYLQAPLLRRELAILIRDAEDEEVRKLLEQMDQLLIRCASERHLYVKFYGD